ncbi:hypothetical protein V5O48_007937 [Marasmius crinis-equi]|uniref:F-box domain-containing protein n=1 Tax=Marasmius crinis-equi TaxID=585013 RepID=A0ABR3FF89_9AGAR
MSSVSPSSISLPNELTEQIISLLWLSPLTISERIRFIQSSVEMSGLWHAIFIRVASKDFYIIGCFHASIFLDFLRGKREIFASNSLNLTGLCRSITIQHANDCLFPGSLSLQPIGHAFRDILRELSNNHSPVQLPSLRRISLELKNHLMGQVFQSNASLFTYFPERVAELEIKFTYGEDVLSTQIQGIKRCYYHTYGLKRANYVGPKKLIVLGGSTGGTIELLRVFGGPKQIQFTQDAWREAEQPAALIEQDFFDDETPLEPFCMRVKPMATVDHPDLEPFRPRFCNDEPDGRWLI